MDKPSEYVPDRGIWARGLLPLGVIFFLGLVCGASLFYLGQRSVGHPGREGFFPPGPQGPGGRPPLAFLARELGLSPEQREQIRVLMRRSRGEIRQTLEGSREEIRSILTPEQREKFDKLGPELRRGFGRRPRPRE